MTRSGYWGNQSPTALGEQPGGSFLSQNLCPGSVSPPGVGTPKSVDRKRAPPQPRRGCRQGGRERPSERRRSSRRWRPSPVRGGKLRGCERLSSAHRELVRITVVAVGWVGWWETGETSPPGDPRCSAGAVGSGPAFSLGRYPGIVAEQLVLPFCSGPCRHLPVPDHGICARGAQAPAPLTWQGPTTYLVLARPSSS